MTSVYYNVSIKFLISLWYLRLLYCTIILYPLWGILFTVVNFIPKCWEEITVCSEMTQLLQYNTGRQIISIFSMQHSLHLVHKLHAFFFSHNAESWEIAYALRGKKNARVPWSPDQHRLVIPLPATYRAAFWISSPWKEPSSILIKGKNIF